MVCADFYVDVKSVSPQRLGRVMDGAGECTAPGRRNRIGGYGYIDAETGTDGPKGQGEGREV